MSEMNETLLENLLLKTDTSPDAKKALQRQQWANDVDEYLRNGGTITHIPQGQSGLTTEEIEDYQSKGRNQCNKRSSTRNSTTAVYLNGNDAPKYEGKPCRKCGLVLRYCSNDKCVSCAKSQAKEKRHAEA